MRLGIGHKWAAHPYLRVFRITHLINKLRSCFQCCLLLFRVGTLAFNEKRQKIGQLFKSSAHPGKELSQLLEPLEQEKGPASPASLRYLSKQRSFRPCHGPGWSSHLYPGLPGRRGSHLPPVTLPCSRPRWRPVITVWRLDKASSVPLQLHGDSPKLRERKGNKFECIGYFRHYCFSNRIPLTQQQYDKNITLLLGAQKDWSRMVNILGAQAAKKYLLKQTSYIQELEGTVLVTVNRPPCGLIVLSSYTY